ncbi:AbrB/MazE/SpoVT family DNA-binding domain-containing protein [Natronobiforma cellulositropha]|uniref:AbrB/MazE/SpoVT family DNA-binding domain-containing protein n=1 Tax=Natronobiforma cellulositropha TaxID=1679076 RepID=UPI0021D60126|nr:AbrB/MazE/SpoVT family DNA-binding domain-containing protein [Natronobiforma cellulositropha]
MSVETDSHGRLYLSSELRQKYGEKFHIVEYEDRLELVPIDADPLQAVREAAGGAFDGKSAAELKGEALEQARQEASEDLERRHEAEDFGE